MSVNTKPIRAILFDLDGTLLDGIALYYSGFQTVAGKYGLPEPTYAEFKNDISLALPLDELLKKHIPASDPSKVWADYFDHVVPRRAEIKPFDYLHELLGSLKRSKLHIAIVTGGNEAVHKVLEHNKMSDYFTSVVHCDRVVRSKPHPEGVELALAECGVSPGEAIMIGDTSSDVLAGKNAGVAHTIGITHGYGTPDSLKVVEPSHIVHSLAELQPLILKLV